MFVTGNSNWIDAYYFVSDVEVDMMVETRGIQGVAIVDTLPTMSHRILPAGNKIVFVAYDPIALNTAVDSTYPYYYWVGYDTSNSVHQALKWFGIFTDVNETGIAPPTEFILAQNYPNPFNPGTVISYKLPVSGKVILKVYDILGREVITLVNEEKPAGKYEVEFNAEGLASGIYFYQLKVTPILPGGRQDGEQAGYYIETKKMVLLR